MGRRSIIRWFVVSSFTFTLTLTLTLVNSRGNNLLEKTKEKTQLCHFDWQMNRYEIYFQQNGKGQYQVIPSSRKRVREKRTNQLLNIVQQERWSFFVFGSFVVRMRVLHTNWVDLREQSSLSMSSFVKSKVTEISSALSYNAHTHTLTHTDRQNRKKGTKPMSYIEWNEKWRRKETEWEREREKRKPWDEGSSLTRSSFLALRFFGPSSVGRPATVERLVSHHQFSAQLKPIDQRHSFTWLCVFLSLRSLRPLSDLTWELLSHSLTRSHHLSLTLFLSLSLFRAAFRVHGPFASTHFCCNTQVSFSIFASSLFSLLQRVSRRLFVVVLFSALHT